MSGCEHVTALSELYDPVAHGAREMGMIGVRKIAASIS